MLKISCAGLVVALVPASATGRAKVVYSPTVAEMVAGVSWEELAPVVEELSGEVPAVVGGKQYTFVSRSSFSGAAIDNAEQYLYEKLLSYGLDSVEYHDFPGEDGAPPGRNVIGQIDGKTLPDEIVVLGAHIDSAPWQGPAPGADDDASGISAGLYLARSFAGRSFERTIRFAFFGAEENAPWECQEIGSAGYAALCKARGEKIVAMIQADAIAYDPPESAEWIVEMNTRTPEDDPEELDSAFFQLWVEAIEAYSIEGLVPVHVAISNNWSDHGSFWNNDYPAAMLIAEELAFYNPHWHSAADTVDKFAWPFYVEVTRSFVAVAAHLAGFMEPPPWVADDPGSTPDVGPGDGEIVSVLDGQTLEHCFPVEEIGSDRGPRSEASTDSGSTRRDAGFASGSGGCTIGGETAVRPQAPLLLLLLSLLGLVRGGRRLGC